MHMFTALDDKTVYVGNQIVKRVYVKNNMVIM